MDRRAFLIDACRTCAALAALPVAASIEGCASAKVVPMAEGVATVPLSLLGDKPSAVVAVKGLPNKLLLVRRADGGYHALELNCPHKNGPLKEKDGRLVCAWHGSAFSLDGELLKGPSRQGLRRYMAEAAGDQVRIRLA
ncbi:MAG: Rieske (2Fe-2S) protein [Flavobacteriales bacterium]